MFPNIINMHFISPHSTNPLNLTVFRTKQQNNIGGNAISMLAILFLDV